jgi:hypothetical protein
MPVGVKRPQELGHFVPSRKCVVIEKDVTFRVRSTLKHRVAGSAGPFVLGEPEGSKWTLLSGQPLSRPVLRRVINDDQFDAGGDNLLEQGGDKPAKTL